MILSTKSLVAYITFVRALICVGSLVNEQVVGFGELALTKAAYEFCWFGWRWFWLDWVASHRQKGRFLLQRAGQLLLLLAAAQTGKLAHCQSLSRRLSPSTNDSPFFGRLEARRRCIRRSMKELNAAWWWWWGGGGWLCGWCCCGCCCCCCWSSMLAMK